MLDFTFQNPTKVIFGKDKIRHVADEIPRGTRVMITCGEASAEKYGVLDEVREACTGHQITEFEGISPNPEYEMLLTGVELARRKKIDYLLAVGGGSVIDGTKFIAAAVQSDEEPSSLLENAGAGILRALPVGCVVTLPASGSEANNRAVISRRAYLQKTMIANDRLFPRFAILDPSKTFTLPPSQVGNGVVDTFVHVLEQYLTYPVNGKVQDRLAEGLLLLLIEEGPRALAEPDNYDVRANLMWAATLGLNGLIGAGVPQDWAAHRFGYGLTMLYGLDHAQTLAVLVPAMLYVRAATKREKLLQYAENVWRLGYKSETMQIGTAIEKTRQFFESMRVPTRLGDYNLPGIDIEQILKLSRQHGMINLGERNEVTLEMLRKILNLSL
jgi:NADP-dependent alcohol dehydrogenase